MHTLIKSIIDQALIEAKKKEVPIYTFALYYDHESPAISVCIDTEENSKAKVKLINSYNRKHFISAIERGDMKNATLWLANTGRSLSLGDFYMINVARKELANTFVPDDEFFFTMAQVLVASETTISAQAVSVDSALLCCSGKNAEVELWWSIAQSEA